MYLASKSPVENVIAVDENNGRSRDPGTAVRIIAAAGTIR
jgi:hypothetical protein